MTESLPYRLNVGAVLFNAAGKVFVGRRADMPPELGHVWQFPQGGIDHGEDQRDAVLRELREEIGTANAEILGEHADWLQYDLPAHLVGQAFGGKYRGQRQRWFALRFLGADSDIDLAAHTHPEFAEWRWIDLSEAPALAVDFKRPIYETLARDFARFAAPALPPDFDASPFPPDRYKILRVRNRAGSVEHYYHFILGFLAPLLLRRFVEEGATPYLIRSCGPFDKHLSELGVRNVTIIPRQAWEALNGSGAYRIDRVFGYDLPDHYDPKGFRVLRRMVLERLNLTEISPEQRVLIINRGRSPDYYQSSQAENPSSANMRRSVPNMPEINAALRAEGVDSSMLELETSTLRDQVALFARTRTLVAQHGAALVNMLWMPPGGRIVEVLPEVSPRFATMFRVLAQVCGHKYTVIKQDSQHAPVPPADILHALRV